MKRIICLASLAAALLTSASAFAYDGYVTRTVSLRAGPDSSYPTVARLRRGTTVVIEGCVDDWSWCDVSTRRDRGWVDGDYLQNEYQGHRVLVPRYGVQIGIPIISFVFGSYWDDHYRSRSWYRERNRWSRVTPRYEHGGRAHGSDSRAVGAPPQPQVRPPRPSGATAPQPTYPTRPQPATVAPTPQRAPAPAPRTQERTTSPAPAPVERNASEPRPPRQQQDQNTPHRPNPPVDAGAEHRATAPAREAVPTMQKPEQPKSLPAQAAGRDKARDQGDKAQGRDKSKENGKDKDKDKDKDGGGG